MITFREVSPNNFILLKDSLLTFYKHDSYLTKLGKTRGVEFKRKEEQRGTNEKFWLINDEFNNKLIFKGTARKGSKAKENGYIYGELITDLLCNKIGLDNTSYYPCIVIFEDGTSVRGTISPSYRKGKLNNEYSAQNITTRYVKSQYDNNYGEVPYIEFNTVDEYIKQLKYLYKNRLSEAKFKEFEQYLLQIALFDYVTCQTDRHWGNIGWINNAEVGIQTMKPIPIYDNESCFLMNKPFDQIETLADRISRSRDWRNGIIVPMVNGIDRVPRLGISSATTICNDGIRLLKKPNIPGQKTHLEVFREELAEKIINNKELEKLYRKIKNINLEQLLTDCDYFPESVITVASKIWQVRIEQLEKVLQNKKESSFESDNERSV